MTRVFLYDILWAQLEGRGLPDIINDINWLDITFIVLLCGMLFKGLRTGVGGQIISLIGLFVLVFVSIHYYGFISEGLFGFMLQKWAKPVTFFFITIATFTVVRILERIFSIAAGDDMAFVERIGGMVVACLRAVLFFGVISIQLMIIPLDYTREAVTEDSKSAMFFVNADAEVYSQMAKYLGISDDISREELIDSLLNSSTDEPVQAVQNKESN